MSVIFLARTEHHDVIGIDVCDLDSGDVFDASRYLDPMGPRLWIRAGSVTPCADYPDETIIIGVDDDYRIRTLVLPDDHMLSVQRPRMFASFN